MNYHQFDAEDLAADDHFKKWVCAPSPGTEAFWTRFLTDYPERYDYVADARQLITGLGAIQHETAQPGTIETIWGRIEHTVEQSRPVPVMRWLTEQRAWPVAAMLLLMLGVGWWLGQQPVRSHHAPTKAPAETRNEWTETRNEANQLMQIQLADGSRVDLQRGGRLRYRPELAGAQREVYLTGDAFFCVKKNPEKPFVVYANGLVAKVLGTSFRINAPAGASTVTVTVRTGRVSVYPNRSGRVHDPESTGLVLTPNQKAVFHRDAATLDKLLVESPALLIPKKDLQQFVFDDAPAARVFDAIERAYGVDIVFDEDLMQHCTLTLSLDDEDLFQKIDVICKVLDAQYKLIDAQIVIYSKGCPRPDSTPIKQTS